MITGPQFLLKSYSCLLRRIADRDKLLTEGSGIFDYIPTGRISTFYDSQRTNFVPATETKAAQSATRASFPFEKAVISHELASELIGVSKKEIGEMFAMIKQGKQIPSREVPGTYVRLDVEVESYESTSRNVIAVVVGSDPVLKNEYTSLCS